MEAVLALQGDSVPTEAPDEMYDEVINTFRSGNTVNLPPRKLSRVIASRMRQITNEADAAELLVRMWPYIKEQSRGSLYRSLLVGCLSCTDKNFKTLNNLIDTLKKSPHIFGSRWESRINTYQLLDEPFGHGIVEKLYAADNKQEREKIEVNSGLRSFRNVGLGTCVYRHSCTTLRTKFSSNTGGEDKLAHLQRWSEIAIENGNLRFTGEDLVLGIESMVLPWTDTPPIPPLQNAIKSILISSVGDPRIKAANWSSIDPDCTNVFKRWLAQESFDVFIQVISKVAMVRHWQARKEFWGWYLEQGYIDEIWPIVGPKGVSELNRTIAQAQDGLQLEFGSLSGASSDHCVLLIRMGGITIAEWSHNGSARFWLSDNAQAPELYKRRYSGDGLRRHSDYGIAHSSNWEGKLNRIIRQYTGIAHPNYTQGKNISPKSETSGWGYN